MSYLAFLDLAVNGSPEGRWLSIAARLGYPVQVLDGTPPIAPQAIDRFLAEAEGFLLFTPTFIHDQSIQNKIHTAIANGKRAIVQCSLNHIDLYNRFLDQYGVQATSLKAFVRNPVAEHPRLFPLRRNEEPDAFCYRELLDGVHELILQQPNVLKCDDRAVPLLALPLEKTQITERTTDFEEDWYLSRVPIASLCDPEFRVQGGVVALYAGFFHDPYVGAMGTSFPGIAAADNEHLVQNLLRWVARDLLPTPSRNAQAYELIHQIEYGLARLTTKVLNAHVGPSWWEHAVPHQIRARAEKRRDREQKLLPARSYLELPDYRSIFETNWVIFARIMANVRWTSPDALAWFDRLRDIRNRTMHPTKEALSGGVASVEELQFLMRISDNVGMLVRSFGQSA